jgi:hypothetical protein
MFAACWQHRSRIFPRDPDFEAKASRVLELYAGAWEGEPLEDGAFVVSSDEKTSFQAQVRCHETLGACPIQRGDRDSEPP